MMQNLKNILMPKIGNCYGMRSNSKEKELAELIHDERDVKEIETYWVMHMGKKIDNWYETRSNDSRTPEQEEEFVELTNEIVLLLSDIAIGRKVNEETGLKDLVFE